MAAALPRGLCAAVQAAGDDHVSLLSDVHVSGSGSGSMAQRLTLAVRQVVSLASRPDKVLVAGDCAHLHGKARDYREYVRLLEPLLAAQLPLHMTLGNHDDRENFWDALPAGQTKASDTGIERQAAVVPGRLANWFLLDSLNKTNRGAGELGRDQLGWLEAALDERTDKPALVMLHHNPDRIDNKGSLNDSDALFDIVRPRRHVKAMFFGHTHIWNVSQDRSGIHMVNLPATGYTLWLRSFIGWVDCRVHERGARLFVHALKPGAAEDGQVVRLAWRAG
jgi:3',5'-cyclic AMP phosphodiesterase CpdA